MTTAKIGYALAATLAIAAPACASLSRFTPNSAADGRLAPLVYPAVQAYPGDVKALEAAGGRLIGWLRVRPAKALRAASRYGATHLVRSEVGMVIDGVVSPPKAFGLVRVEPEHWAELGAALRPGTRFEPLPAGCSCSNEGPYGGVDSGNFYVRCGEAEPRVATAGEVDAYCEPL